MNAPNLVQPNRERFLAAIAERVAPERVQALYLFPAIRSGPVETCIAVIAVEPLVAVSAELLTADDADEGRALAEQQQEQVDAGTALVVEAPLAEAVVRDPALPNRPVVLTARYRHTLKGADRGKWELEILEQADASLVTLEKVIQGVLQRLDDSTEPERLGPDAMRAALADGVWATPQR